MQRHQRLLIPIFLLIIVAIWLVLPNNPGIHIGGIEKEIETRLGLDLVGGVQALLEADLPEGTSVDAESMRTAVRIVENRVNSLGVSEALVQQAGDNRVVVELPGETDPEHALSLLQQTGLLEFVDFSELTSQEVFELNNVNIQTDFGLSEEQMGDSEANKLIPATEVISSTEGTVSARIFHTIMTGADIKNIQVTTDQSGKFQVAFELTPEGTQTFKEFTTTHVGDTLAIVLDNKIISAPNIQEPITDGSGVISGNFTLESSNTLAIQLRYGSLPIPLKVVEVRTVGPTLGQDSLQKSLVAGLIGFIIVIMFMALYYRLPGVVADISIIIYALFAFAIFRFIPVTLTLPGIAGFLLSTGSALDANILIFERIKEELRAGKSVTASVELGWKRAWPSIRDSNIATLITCGILFWFGSAFGATIVKGFSLTLGIGVLISLFTALVITRIFLNTLFRFYTPTNLEKWFGI